MAPTPTPHARISLEEREVHRIYQPWLSAHGSSLSVADNVESLAINDLHGQGYQPRASRDKALTAFAQLVALRLNVRRCMISLIDTSSQYILAEATRTVSIASSRTADDDELWLGSAKLSRPDAICEHSMFNVCTAVDEESGQTFTAKGLIVPDCRLDDRFKDRPYVLSEPGVRFYAGVPIYSRNSYVIGSVAISDDLPRNSLRVEELKLMQETAQSAIEHLEWYGAYSAKIELEAFANTFSQYVPLFFRHPTRPRVSHACVHNGMQTIAAVNIAQVFAISRCTFIENIASDLLISQTDQ